MSSLPRRRTSFGLAAIALMLALFAGWGQVYQSLSIPGPLPSTILDVPIIKEAVMLEFLHIPKNGGSAIEKAAAEQAGIVWGACHFRKVGPCASFNATRGQPDLKDNVNVQILASRRRQLNQRGDPWHVPLQYFTVNPFHVLWNNFTLQQQQQTRTTIKIFTIVRNPYTRAVSRYYCFFGGYQGPDKTNVTVFNAWIQDTVKIQKGITLIPQHLYVYNNTTQMVDHVLHYERLAQEFHDLMNEYQLGIILPEKKYNAGRRHVLSSANLTKTSINLINRVYANDFAYFGYDFR